MIRVLHLSDLHFGMMPGSPSKSAHWFVRPHATTPGQPEPHPAQLAQLLARSWTEDAPHVMVVSGDVGWSGSEEDYRYAEEFFARLKAAFPNAPLVVTPGNHDVDRTAASDEGRQASFVAMLKRLYRDEFDSTYPLYATRPSRDRLIGVHQLTQNGRTVAVLVAFNSAGGLQNESIPVRIAPDALADLDEYLQRDGLPEEALKVCILHHHLFPFAEPAWDATSDTQAAWERRADPDLLANSAKLQGWLAQRRFHIVLHGHKHTSHGREDLLWRRSDRSGRRLLVIGAGSAGVESGHRAQMEPLSFNRISATRLSTQRWRIDVDVQEVRVDVAVPEVASLYRYRSVAGAYVSDEEEIPLFRAERMDDCHRAIALNCKGEGQKFAFLSIVDDPRYVHPESASYKAEPVEMERVENCFRQLHPEYDPETKWDDCESFDTRLRRASVRYRFEHGTRLVLSPDGRTRLRAEEIWDTSPLLRVVAELKRDPFTSKAFVGLYRPDVDVLGAGREPLPGLMSLHFARRGRALDVTATFRKLELSFWWCVNMMEAGELLSWVASHAKMEPGRITFFATLAEWKFDPEAAVQAEVDRLPVSQLLPLVLNSEWSRLEDLLAEKLTVTNDNNLDPSGLAQIVEIMSGIHAVEPGNTPSLREHIARASTAIDGAVRASQHTERRLIKQAIDALETALALLRAQAGAAPLPMEDTQEP